MCREQDISVKKAEMLISSPSLHSGVLEDVTVAYETWGTLNKAKDNAVLLHTGLSASSHAKSHKVAR